MFNDLSDNDCCPICGETIVVKDIERCPDCKAKLYFNSKKDKHINEDEEKNTESKPKQKKFKELTQEQKEEQEKEKERNYKIYLDYLHEQKMQEINDEFNKIFSKKNIYDNLQNFSLKELKPKFKMMKKELYNKKNGKLEAPKCGICLNKIKSGQMIYLLACKHIIHKVCGDDWFKKKTECPYCRRYVYYIYK